MAPSTLPGDQARGPALDGTLLTRLWRRAEQPGCVRLGQARALLARHRRMVSEPPLAELLLRRSRVADIQPNGPLIVTARPAAAGPGVGPSRAPTPGARPSPEPAPGATATGAVPSAASPPTVRARLARPPLDQPPGQPFAPRREAQAPVDPAGRPSSLPAAVANSPAARATRSLTSPAGARPLVGATGPDAPRRNLAPPGIPVPAQPDTGAARPDAPRRNPAPAGSPTAAQPASTPPVATVPSARPRVTAPSGRPGVIAAAAQPGGTVPAGSPVLSVAARLVPGPATMPPGTGPESPPTLTVSETRRPVVRVAAGRETTALTGPRAASEQAACISGAARPPVPVVRERVPPPVARRPGPAIQQRPAVLPRPASPSADPTVSGQAADRARAARVPSRTSPDRPAEPAELSGRRAEPREPARPAPPQIDLNRIVSTVQRRLTHQIAIERERRGMRR